MIYQISKFLDNFLKEYDLNISELALKLEVSQPYISYIKNGTKTASKKFIQKMTKVFPQLRKKENDLLLMLDNDKKIEKLKHLEKKRRETIGKDEKLENFSKMTKKEKIEYNEFINGATYFFNDEKVENEDKDKLMSVLTEIYFKSKEIKKKKWLDGQKK